MISGYRRSVSLFRSRL